MNAPVKGLTIIRVTTEFQQGANVISRIADLATQFAGVLTWEAFSVPNSDTLILSSSYESEDAITEWENHVGEAGLGPDMATHLEVVADYALTPITGAAGLAATQSGVWTQATLIASK